MKDVGTSDTPIDDRDLKERLTWLVSLRWSGILGVLVVTNLALELSAVSFSLIPMYLILGVASISNYIYLRRLKLPGENLRRLALIQLGVDQLILAFSVYFSGGGDSPYICFFLFHVVISGTILPWQYPFAFAGMAVILPAVLVGLKLLGVPPHYSIFKNEPMITDNTVIMIYEMVFVGAIFLTAYFAAYLSRQLYNKNEGVLKLYNLSKKLRSSLRFNEVVGIVERELQKLLETDKSGYLQLNKEKRILSFKAADGELCIPLSEKNSFTESIQRGAAMILDRSNVKLDCEIKVLDLMDTKRCMILPVMAASLQLCSKYFQCVDTECAAFENPSGKCWQISGTHCKGSIYGNYDDKLAACLTCEIFTPVGVYVLDVSQKKIPLLSIEADAVMHLLQAAGFAISNALLHEKTMKLSKTDGLTGLKNYRAFKDVFHAELLRSRRYHRGFSFLMIDVDYFKQYNDTNGHPQGDVLLKKLAELILDNFKDTDIVARYGGEEFAVLLLETKGKNEAVGVAERFKGIVEWCKFPNEELQPGGKVTVSIGVSCCPGDGTTVEELIQAADAALYCAKRGGRNRVVAAGNSSEHITTTETDGRHEI